MECSTLAPSPPPVAAPVFCRRTKCLALESRSNRVGVDCGVVASKDEDVTACADGDGDSTVTTAIRGLGDDGRP